MSYSDHPRNRVNDDIRSPKVRLIDENKNQVGIVQIQEALQRARTAELDLVEISPNSDPPVCRIMDYGKFLYEQHKKEKEAKKHQHMVKMKEIKFSPRISDHDYSYRMEQAKKFIADGDRVKVTVVFKGREMSHREFGMNIIERLVTDLESCAVLDRNAEFAGRNLMATFVPKR